VVVRELVGVDMLWSGFGGVGVTVAGEGGGGFVLHLKSLL
jgi:hypothetical protein